MKWRGVSFALCIGALAVQGSTVIATAADLTCQAYGGSFALDDDDFKALTSAGATWEQINSSPERRTSFCDSRKLWRLIKVGKASVCDVLVHYKNHNPLYYTFAEMGVIAHDKAYDGAYYGGLKCSEK